MVANGVGIFDENEFGHTFFRSVKKPFATILGPVSTWLSRRGMRNHVISAFTGCRTLSLDKPPCMSLSDVVEVYQKVSTMKNAIYDYCREADELTLEPDFNALAEYFSLNAFCKASFGDSWSFWEGLYTTPIGVHIYNMKASLTSFYENLTFLKVLMKGQAYNTAVICNLVANGGLLDVTTRAITRQIAIDFIFFNCQYLGEPSSLTAKLQPPKELLSAIVNMTASSTKLSTDHLVLDLEREHISKQALAKYKLHPLNKDGRFVEGVCFQPAEAVIFQNRNAFLKAFDEYFKFEVGTSKILSEKMKDLFGFSLYTATFYLDSNPNLKHWGGEQCYEPYLFAIIKFVKNFTFKSRFPNLNSTVMSPTSLEMAIDNAIKEVQLKSKNETLDVSILRKSGFEHFFEIAFKKSYEGVLRSKSSFSPVIKLKLLDKNLVIDYFVKNEERFQQDVSNVYIMNQTSITFRKLDESLRYRYTLLPKKHRSLNGTTGNDPRSDFYKNAFLKSYEPVKMSELKRLTLAKYACDISAIPKIMSFAMSIITGVTVFRTLKIWDAFSKTKDEFLDLKSSLQDFAIVIKEVFDDVRESQNKSELKNRLEALNCFVSYEFPLLDINRVLHLKFANLLEAGSVAVWSSTESSEQSSDNSFSSPSTQLGAPPRKRRNLGLTDLASIQIAFEGSLDYSPNINEGSFHSPRRPDFNDSYFDGMPQLEVLERRLVESGQLDSQAVLPRPALTVCQILEQDSSFKY